MPQRNIFHHLANSIQKNTSNHLPIQGAIFLHQPKKIQVEWLTVQSQTFSKPFPQTFCGPMPLTGAPGIWLMLSGYRLPTYMARHIISCQKIGPRQATEPCSVLWKKYVANVKLQRQRNEKESDKAFMYIYIYSQWYIVPLCSVTLLQSSMQGSQGPWQQLFCCRSKSLSAREARCAVRVCLLPVGTGIIKRLCPWAPWVWFAAEKGIPSSFRMYFMYWTNALRWFDMTWKIPSSKHHMSRVQSFSHGKTGNFPVMMKP